MSVDAAKVKELREKTGLPMMECKRALEKTEGVVEKAIEELRKSGAKAQEKLAGRAATQGRIGSRRSADGRSGILVALRCETDPVAGNQKFQEFLGEVVEVIDRQRPANLEKLLDAPLPSGGVVSGGITELINQLRENISIGRFARFEADAVAQYVHFDNKKAAMVALKGGSIADVKVEEIGKDLCMHIVFNKPQCLTRAKLSPALVAKEKEILLAAAKNDPKNEGKPEAVLEKIVEGQVNKFIQDQCLLEQPFIKNDKLSVEKYLKSTGTGLAIEDFVYVATDL
jgi:elongation factor Ts